MLREIRTVDPSELPAEVAVTETGFCVPRFGHDGKTRCGCDISYPTIGRGQIEPSARRCLVCFPWHARSPNRRRDALHPPWYDADTHYITEGPGRFTVHRRDGGGVAGSYEGREAR